MANSVFGAEVPGRAAVGTVVALLLAVAVFLACWRKAKGKARPWFSPIGHRAGASLLTRAPLRQSDYRWWAAAACLYLVWWAGACLGVGLGVLADYSSGVSQALAHGGVHFWWDPRKVIVSGAVGGFDAVYADDPSQPGGQTSLMPYVMSQTGVTYYMYGVLSETLSGGNLAGAHTPFFAWPDAAPGETMDLTGGARLEINPGMPHYINDVLKSLTPERLAYVNSLLSDWLRSYAYSAALLTQLCQMLAVAFPVSILASRKRDYASLLAPWSALGGLVALFGGAATDPYVRVDAAFLFFDLSGFLGYHAFLLVVGGAWIAYCGRYTLRRFLYVYALILAYVAYVCAACAAFGITYFTTATTPHDYAAGGAYQVIGAMAANTSLTWPGTGAATISVFAAVVAATLAAKNAAHAAW